MQIKTYDITGFPGEYEHATQKLLWTGLQFLQENNVTSFNSKQNENIIGVAINEGKIEEQFDNALKEVVQGFTGAMHQCATNHALYIHFNGYQKWCDKLESRDHDDDDDNKPYYYDFDGTVDLTNPPVERK